MRPPPQFNYTPMGVLLSIDNRRTLLNWGINWRIVSGRRTILPPQFSEQFIQIHSEYTEKRPKTDVFRRFSGFGKKRLFWYNVASCYPRCEGNKLIVWVIKKQQCSRYISNYTCFWDGNAFHGTRINSQRLTARTGRQAPGCRMGRLLHIRGNCSVVGWTITANKKRAQNSNLSQALCPDCSSVVLADFSAIRCLRRIAAPTLF